MLLRKSTSALRDFPLGNMVGGLPSVVHWGGVEISGFWTPDRFFYLKRRRKAEILFWRGVSRLNAIREVKTVD